MTGTLFLTDVPPEKTQLFLMQFMYKPKAVNFNNQPGKEITFLTLAFVFTVYRSYNFHLLLDSKFMIRATVYSPRPHPVKLNNLPQCKDRLRPQPDRPRAFPSYTLPAWLPFQGQETSHWPCTYPTHPLIRTSTYTPQMTSPIHPYISVISCLFPPSL